MVESNNKLITGEEALYTFITEIEVNGTQAPISNGKATISVDTLPSVTSSDNGKVLMVSNGSWQVNPVTNIYMGSGTPSQSIGKDGDIYIQS